MTWLIEILLEEKYLMKYCVIKHLILLKIPNMIYIWKLVSMVYKCFDKKSALSTDQSASGSGIKNENISNEELTEELHKPITRKL